MKKLALFVLALSLCGLSYADDLNSRQQDFISELKEVATLATQLYEKSFKLKESFAEEFKSSQDNALDVVGLEDALEVLGLDYSAIQVACDQALTNYVNFYTNEAVATREYGKDLRRVMNLD